MKVPAKSAAWMLPLLLLTGCLHRHQVAQIQPLAPPLVETPPPSPPPQITTVPQPPTVAETAPEPVPAPPPKSEPKKHVRRRKPVTKDNTPTEVADNAVPAIGQLSSGDPPDLRLQTQNSINNTERQLAGIKGNLSDQDKRTIEHIEEFLKQAKKALETGDVDGASTLAAKAKVLLAEVVQ
jgi:outer membrane biosynthesis protein TonB